MGLEINKKEINFIRDKISIDQRVIFPKGFKIKIHPGTEINFVRNGNILSYSPIIINGERDNPVIIRAKINNKKDINRFGNGISIINEIQNQSLKIQIFLT